MIMDPIADLLTRIRNANMKLKEKVDIPTSKMKEGIARILKDEGFISNYKVLYNEGRQGTLRVTLKYTPTKEPVLKGLKRVSKPGLRVYRGYEDMPRIRAGLGVNVLSTSKGLLTDRQAKEAKVGGEILCQVW
jgi:small subunit ribosomal protein S8